MSELVRHLVPPQAGDVRLDRFLAGRHAELSRSRLQALIDEGLVRVNGAAAKASQRLRGGETIEVEIPAERPAEPEAQELPLRILHEDDDVIVLDKEPGIVVHPAAGRPDGTLVNALLFHVREMERFDGAERPGIVHRLDRDTSGCLVVAKSEASLESLQAAFRSRTVEKRYLALVHGVPSADAFTLDTPYGRHPRVRTKYTGRNPIGPERRAVTHVRILERFAGASLLEVDLETGRTHQIRVHLSEAGHPILADREYGGERKEAKLPASSVARRAAAAIGRQALHAHRLAFPHPRSGDRLAFEAPIPADFQAALDVLRA
ncbi:RluA family pseudouridine synthase [Vulgatibacter incomptus]|uniref:Pseudouridine synthase n=1 Tax=Vulgatibacter incomptus TaxID=1391653 RepID=A0A0K1PCM8_9BACT|nr:RluA family pseudouridine synthase [Vulgatibacter incomptus]AKU91270.1 Ribosomal large subunit pseudouridine synthase D [Vulgatibacter incomptus]